MSRFPVSPIDCQLASDGVAVACDRHCCDVTCFLSGKTIDIMNDVYG